MPLYNQVRLDIESQAITPTALAANTNDYAPTGISSARTVLLDGAGFTLTGIAFISNGKILRIININASLNMTLSHEDVGSAAANRFKLPGSTNVTLLPGEACEVWYDSAATRWRTVTDGSGSGTDYGMLLAAANRYILQ